MWNFSTWHWKQQTAKVWAAGIKWMNRKNAHIQIHVHTCTHTPTHTHIHICTHTLTNMSAHMCAHTHMHITHTHMHTLTCLPTDAHTHTHTHAHMHALTHTHTHICSHAHIHTHTHTRTHTHTQIHTLLLQPPCNLAAQGSTTRAAGINWHAATRRQAYLRPTPTECRWPCGLGKRATHHQVGSKGLLVHPLTWWHKSTHHGHCEDDKGGDCSTFFSFFFQGTGDRMTAVTSEHWHSLIVQWTLKSTLKTRQMWPPKSGRPWSELQLPVCGNQMGKGLRKSSSSPWSEPHVHGNKTWKVSEKAVLKRRIVFSQSFVYMKKREDVSEKTVLE